MKPTCSSFLKIIMIIIGCTAWSFESTTLQVLRQWRRLPAVSMDSYLSGQWAKPPESGEHLRATIYPNLPIWLDWLENLQDTHILNGKHLCKIPWFPAFRLRFSLKPIQWPLARKKDEKPWKKEEDLWTLINIDTPKTVETALRTRVKDPKISSIYSFFGANRGDHRHSVSQKWTSKQKLS